MKGSIIYASKYGSTAEYARWIAEATGLPLADVREVGDRLPGCDFLVLGTAIIYYRPILHKWITRHRAELLRKPVLLFTVSGAGPSAKLDGWLADRLPADLVAHMEHFALRGRQSPDDLTVFDWTMLKIAGLMNRDRKVGREEATGFDYMDRASIDPLVARIGELAAT